MQLLQTSVTLNSFEGIRLSFSFRNAQVSVSLVTGVAFCPFIRPTSQSAKFKVGYEILIHPLSEGRGAVN